MDDLEKAIVISFDESGTVDSALKSQAVEFCRRVKENPNISTVCIERLWSSNWFQVQFWCLQCLHEAVRFRYSSMSQEERSFIRKSLFAMACYESVDGEKSGVRVLDGPVYVRNKLAQVIVALIYFEYPSVWSSVFIDYIPHLSKGTIVIDMFCRVLNALDEELISLDYPRNTEETAIAARVKDAMRQQCVHTIVNAWYNILCMYKKSDAELCSNVLDSMRRYISWIDIGLVANDMFVPLLFDLILVEGLSGKLRGSAAHCVLAVVSKRMVDPQAKLNLLQSLQIRRVFGLITEDADSELVSSIAALLTGYATEVLECSKRITSDDGRRLLTDLLDEVLPSVFFVMQNCEVDATFSIVQFLSGYVSTMKSLSTLTEKQLVHVSQILEVIRSQICYDPDYRDHLDSLDMIGKEEEERMLEHRKDLFVLLRSVGRVTPDVTQMFIRNSLASAVASSSGRNIEEVEAALSLLYALGESMSDEAMRTGSGLLGELVPMLLSMRFPCQSNRLVALTYLETISRFMKFVQENTQYIPMALTAFLDERGIHHPNINVSRRASYLFMRVVKLLKSKLIPYIDTILQSLQDTVAQFTSMGSSTKEISGSEDGSHIFEAIGILIGMEDVPVERQTDYLSSLLTPLCGQVEAFLVNAKVQNVDDTPSNFVVVQQIIMAINALSKGFNERLATTSRPAVGSMFKQTLDVLVQILIVFPKVESLRIKVTSFIHRMVETLGASIFPHLPKALEQLLAESEPKEMVGFLVLLNQLICKFSTSVHDILEEVFPAIASRIFSVLPQEEFPSGPNTEELRELQELQRTMYTFLHVISTHDLASVFLLPKSRPYLDAVMQRLLYASCNHKDILVRKTCVQIFIRLIKDWCGGPFGEEKVPGFERFIIEVFATNCCLYSVLNKSFEFRDANTHLLFGEIVTAQKVMYEKFGDKFIAHFVSKGFLATHCSQDLAEQYHQKLQGNDIKAFRLFYQSVIENMRLQQNGSLVFR